MVSFNKKSFIKVCKVIIISILSTIVIMFSLTKVIYDSTFERYDSSVKVDTALQDIVKSRKLYPFKSGDNTLSGYYYKGTLDGLVILSPGYNSSVDEYLWQIKSLNDFGWSVFAYDSTGCCSSGGESTVGFPQEILDLRAAIEYIESDKNFVYNDLMLFGHSRGGYAACGVMNEYDITAVVTVSGLNSCMEAVIQPVADKIGFLAYGNYPMLWAYQSMLFGSDVVEISASEEISKSDSEVLVVHGTNDKQLSTEKYSIYSYKDEITSNKVEYYLCEEDGSSGHTDLLFDPNGGENKKLMSVVNDFFVRAQKD